MSISIVMPAFNAAHFIHEAIDSILRQTYQDFELLICDDGSSDSTYDLIATVNDSRIRLMRNTQNMGYLKTCNLLFKEAQFDWIGFQDADDISDRFRLERQVEYLSKNPNCVLIGTRAKYFEGSIRQIVRSKDVEIGHEGILEALWKQNQFCGASVLVKKDVLAEVGYYQEFYDRIANEDYDCFFRIAQRYKVANLSEYLYYVRISPGSISRILRNPRQAVSPEVVRYLARQRNDNNGLDSLTGLDPKLLNNYLLETLDQFTRDPSLLFRKNADMAAYSGKLGDLVKYSYIGLRRNILLWINWKYFISSIFRYLLGSGKKV